MDFDGVGQQIVREHLEQLAQAGGLSVAFAQTVIERCAQVASEFAARARFQYAPQR
jgi:hypothetical protein